MSAPRTEELFTILSGVLSGQRTTEEAVEFVQSTQSDIQGKWQEFLVQATDDPEMPVPTREKIAKALEDYLDCLERLFLSLQADDAASLKLEIDTAKLCVESLRAAQNSHRDDIASGPTGFPFLNRFLIQYDAVRRGKNSHGLFALLAESPSFLVWLRKELSARETNPEAVQAVFHLQQFLEAVQNALEGSDSLPEVQDSIIDLSEQIAVGLAPPRLDDQHDGPTDIPAVNQVLEALSSCTGASDEVGFLLSLIEQCRSHLRAATPVSSSDRFLRNLGEVLSSLDTMEHCLTHPSEFEELVAAATDLETNAQAFSGALLAEGEHKEYSDSTSGLPMMMRSVLEPGYQFLAGECDAQVVHQAAAHFHTLVTKMEQDLKSVGDPDERVESLNEAIAYMNEALSMLEQLAETGHPKLLETATALCHEAAAHLRHVGVK